MDSNDSHTNTTRALKPHMLGPKLLAKLARFHDTPEQATQQPGAAHERARLHTHASTTELEATTGQGAQDFHHATGDCSLDTEPPGVAPYATTAPAAQRPQQHHSMQAGHSTGASSSTTSWPHTNSTLHTPPADDHCSSSSTSSSSKHSSSSLLGIPGRASGSQATGGADAGDASN